MAADACKNGHLRALAFNDVALLTATGNDLSYDQVFSLPLERLARPGDLLDHDQQFRQFAEHRARTRGERGAWRAARSRSLARAPTTASRTLGDLNFYVPLSRYGWAESAHQVILHYWFDQYLAVHGQGAA